MFPRRESRRQAQPAYHMLYHAANPHLSCVATFFPVPLGSNAVSRRIGTSQKTQPEPWAFNLADSLPWTLSLILQRQMPRHHPSPFRPQLPHLLLPPHRSSLYRSKSHPIAVLSRSNPITIHHLASLFHRPWHAMRKKKAWKR